MKKLDLFILGGGGILYDRDAEIYLREVLLAHELHVPVLVYAISAGPLNSAPVRDAVAAGLKNVGAITVRDRNAQRLLEEVGVKQEIHVTADPALLLEPEPLPEDAIKREGLDTQRRLVGFSVREPGPAAPDVDVDHYHALLANAADFLVDRHDADIVFIPMERKKMDMQHSHAVIARMLLPHRATVLKGEYSAAQILSLIGHFEFAVGMRLHFLILAALQGVPFVALPYATKVSGFIEDMELEMPPLDRVNAGRLIARIDQTWDTRDSIRAHIQRMLPELKQRSASTNEFAVRLLRERQPGTRKG